MTTKLLRTLMGMVALVAMLTACSSEDVLLDEPNAKNEITFNVTTNRASRAVQIFNSENPPAYFRFAAWEYGGTNPSKNQAYANKDLVVNEGTVDEPKWVNQGGLRYWPNNGATLDFYAWCCGLKNSDMTTEHATFSWGGDGYTSCPTLKFNVDENAANQTDLIYAVQSGQYSPYDEMGSVQNVQLKFYHALSQIVFEAVNQSNKIHIEIDEISICNIPKSASFDFPFKEEKTSKWDFTGVQKDFTFKADIVNEIFETKINTTTGLKETTRVDSIPYFDLGYNETFKLSNGNSTMMLLPCEFGATNEGSIDWDTDTYISIMCKIWNVATPSADKDEKYGWKSNSDNLIHGTSTKYAELRIPISGNWDMGKCYTYKIIFGTGNAGYTADGKAALVPMSYTQTLQDWIDDTKLPGEPGAPKGEDPEESEDPEENQE